MPFDNPHQNPFGDIEILADARNRIADRGNWLKRGFQDGDRNCLVAALSIAAGSRSFQRPGRTERRLARLLAQEIPANAPLLVRLKVMPARQRLMIYNDRLSTRHEDVLGLHDRAIQRLKSRAISHVIT
jgi:hypothetical protein